MFEALIKDPTILEITIVLVVLLAIAFWQNLKQFAAILGGIYFLYIIFIISSYENNLESQIIEENMFNGTLKISFLLFKSKSKSDCLKATFSWFKLPEKDKNIIAFL